MRMRSMSLAVAALLAAATAATAAELSSGVEVGGKIGAYSCTKTGGAEDGVEVGKSLCYT